MFSKVDSINTLPVSLRSSVLRPRNSPFSQQSWKQPLARSLKKCGRQVGPRAATRHLPHGHARSPCCWALLQSPGAGRKQANRNPVTVPERGGQKLGDVEGKAPAGWLNAHCSRDCSRSFCSAPGGMPGREAPSKAHGPDTEAGGQCSLLPGGLETPTP